MLLAPACRSVVALLAAVLILSPLGCGGTSAPDHVQVSGKVGYANGKPLATGMIVFTPQEEGEDAPTAAIQSDGGFAFSSSDAIPPGEYRVSLAEPEEADGASGASSFSAPEKYLQADKSGWTATVKENGNEPFTFTIK